MTKGTVGVVDGMKTSARLRRWESSASVLSLCWFGLPRGWSRACLLKDPGRVEYVAATDDVWFKPLPRREWE